MILIADQFNAAADSTLLIDGSGITSGADIEATMSASSSVTNYMLTISNPGPVDVTDIVVTNWFPAGLTLVSTACTANVQGWQTSGSTNVFTVKSLARGASEVITFNATGAATGTYTNKAVAWPSEGDFDDSNNETEAELVLNFGGMPELAISKVVVSGLVAGHDYTVRGTNLTYLITVTNQGDAATGAWLLNVNDLLPPDVTLLPGEVFNWTLGALAAGEAWHTNLSVAVNMETPASIISNACLLAVDTTVTVTNLVHVCLTPIRPDADVAVWLEPSTNRVGLPPRAYDYMVLVSNAGPCRATAVTVTLDPAPAGLTLNPNPAHLGPFELEVGETRQIIVPATAELALAGSVTNRVVVNCAEHDPDDANNAAQAAVLFDPLADVAVAMAWLNAPDPVAGNTPAGLSVTVTNHGPLAASSVALTLTGAVSDTVALGILPAGGVTNLTFWVQPAVGTDVLHAEAEVQAAELDSVPANNTAQADIAVLWPNVYVGLLDLPDPVMSAATLRYTLWVSNAVVSVTGIVAEVTLPTQVTEVLSAGGGVADGGTLRFGPMDLAAGAGTNWSIEVRAPTVEVVTDINANAAASQPTGDTNPADNTAAAVTQVLPLPKADLQPSITWVENPVEGGTNVAYQVEVVVNNLSGEHHGTNVNVLVWLSAADAALEAPSGWSAEGTLTARLSQVIGALPAAGATSAVFNVRLTGVMADLTAHVLVESGNDDNAANNTAQDILNITWPDAAVTLTSVPVSVVSGAAYNYVLSVTATDARASNMTVDLELPEVLTITDNAGGIATAGGLRFGPLELAAGGSSNWTIVVQAPTVTAVTNLPALARLTPPAGDTDNDNNQDDASTAVTLPPRADVQAYVAWPVSPLAGNTNTGHLLYAGVTNISADVIASNVTLTVWLDDTPALLQVPEGWQLTGALEATLAQAVVSLAPGAGTGAWFTVTQSAVTNRLIAHAQTGAANDENAGNNLAQAQVNVLWPDLRVTLTPVRPQLTEGEELAYTVTLFNDSLVPVANIWVTNSYPEFVTITNAGGGVLVDGTNVCFEGIALAVGMSTSMTVRVMVQALPEGVTSLVSTASCMIPAGDATPENNQAQNEIPVFNKNLTGSLTWVLSHSPGTFFARLVLTNNSARQIESVWFSFADRFVPGSDPAVLQSALWDSTRVDVPQTQRKQLRQFADGKRYVDLTDAVKAALVADGGDDVWDPGEVVAVGVSQATLDRFAATPASSVPLGAERLLEMYDLNRQNPSTFVDLADALGSRSGAFHHDSGIDADGDFVVSAAELAQARVSWIAGALSDEEYLFLSAAYRAAGYKWDMQLGQWVIIE